LKTISYLLCVCGVIAASAMALTWGNTTTMGQAATATLNPTTSNSLGLPIPGGTRPSRLEAVPVYAQRNALLFLNQTPAIQTFANTLLRTISPRRALDAALRQYGQNLANIRAFATRLRADYQARDTRLTPLLMGVVTLTIQEDRLQAINQLPEVTGLLLLNREAAPGQQLPGMGIPPEEYPVETPPASTQ